MSVKESLAGWGILLPTLDPLRVGTPPLLKTAKLAEQVGFDSAWVGDHLISYAPMLEATTSLAAVAAVTERMRLGYGIMLLAARDLAWTAKQIGTLEALAPGRIVMGVGAGGRPPEEWDVVGVDIKTRGRRTDEMIPLIQQALRGEPIDHQGPLITAKIPVLEPVPDFVPPLVIGGTSDAAIRRAGRFGDGWLTSLVDAAFVTEHKEMLQDAAEKAGRPTPQIHLVVFVHVTDDREKGLAVAGEWLMNQLAVPYSAVADFSPVGSAEYLVDHLGTQREAGVDGFVIVPMAHNPFEQVELISEVKGAVMGTACQTSS